MRPIKFRAFDKRHKIMSLPFALFGGVFWPKVHTAANDDVEIMQFTGLLDKNGKEIYEGDILRGNLPPLEGEPEDYHLSIVSVHWEQCFGGWFTNEQRSLWKWLEGPFNAGGNCYGEVVGNVYENPELLNSPTEENK